MSLLEAVRLALAQIRVQKLKSFFTLLGVMIGVMFLIAVVSIVEGMSTYMEEDFAGKLIGPNTFTVRRIANMEFGDVTDEMWREWQRRPRIHETDLRIIRDALPPGTATAIQSEDFIYATSPHARRRQVQAVATDGEYFQIKQYDLRTGRAFSEQEAELGSRVVVIGSEVAEHFFPDLDPLGRELKIGGMPYAVIGVIEKQGSVFGFSLDRLAIAPFRSPLSRLTNPRGDVDGLTVQAATRDQLADQMEMVREAVRSRRKLSPVQPDNFALETSDSALAFFDSIKRKMIVFGTALPAIGLVVGAMVIMNIMLVAVAERTREIGVRKALGATRATILWQFLVEAATLTSIGAGVGLLLGTVAALLVRTLTPIPAAVPGMAVVVALVASALTGVAFGMMPAIRAAKLDPVEALRYE